MTTRVLGVGWGFPVALAGERFAVAHYEESVRQSIVIILSTVKGERVMRPDFGCDLHELVFAPNSSATRGMAEFSVREALREWEPRIDVLRVEAESAGAHGEQLLIQIDYRVRTTDTRFNLVYPFYLDRPLT
jgi:phage baseplate assembly protein W